jgi:hypothetical protein
MKAKFWKEISTDAAVCLRKRDHLGVRRKIMVSPFDPLSQI